MDISGVLAMFAAILIASAVLLYFGIIGIKGDKQEDQLYKDSLEK